MKPILIILKSIKARECLQLLRMGKVIMRSNYMKGLLKKFIASIIKELNLTATEWGGHYER